MSLLKRKKKRERITGTAAGKYIRKVTWIGLIINLSLSGIKFAAGIIGNSQAVIADAVHSLSDSITDIAIIIGSHIWSKPADDTHPYGHGRIETIVTIFIGAVLAIAGIGIGWQAIFSLQNKPSLPPEWPALFGAAISIICKEILYQWTASVGRQLNSAALTANAWHHRLDALSSIPAILAVSGAMIFPSWIFLDKVGAIIVSIMIMHVSWKVIWPGVREILDFGAPYDTCKMIETIVNNHPSVIQTHDIRSRYTGTGLQVDLHMVVDGSLSVREGHDIAEDVKNQLIMEGPNILDVVVHTEPCDKKR